MKFLKYKLSAFFSFFLKDELPPAPFKELDNPAHLVGGRAGRFISSILRSSDLLYRYGFAFGLLNLKKGFPRPDEAFLIAGKLATLKQLTETHPVPKSDIFISEPGSWDDSTREVTLSDLEREVRRTVREVYKGQKFTSEDMYKPYVPSIRANYTSSRSKLGTFGDLRNLSFIVDEEKDASFYADAFYQDFSSEVEERIEDRSFPAYVLRSEFKSELDTRYRKIYDDVRKLALVEEANTTLVPLAEALKVRVISKGPPLTYFVLKPIQKFLHRILRRQRCFKLIGEPVTPEFLDSVYKDEPGDFLSVDYASATDLLNPSLSLACVDEICKVTGIPSDLKNLFDKALTGHNVEGLPQLWGQLMGSIVSFPVLCLVNAAICRYSFEIGEQRQWLSVNDIPLLVNGDDGLIRCHIATKNVWTKLSALGGLSPSVGKVYFSDHYMNINSTSFILKDSTIRHIPYINMGLVKGMTRSEGKVGLSAVADSFQSSFGTIGSRHRELMDSTPYSLRLKVHKIFIKENYDTLTSVKVPWFLPESLGGVGLRPFTRVIGDDVDDVKFTYLEEDGIRYGPSDLDLKCARILLNKYSSPGVNVSKLPTSQPVKARQVWYNNKGFDIPSIHTYGQVSSELKQMASSQNIVSSFLDLSTFYFCPSLVSEVEAQQLSTLRRNERAWGKLSIEALSLPGLTGFDYLHPLKDFKLAYFVHE
jgi:hypothetical protein